MLKPDGRAVVFGKFVHDERRPSLGRRVFNLVTNTFLSDITRQLGTLVQEAGPRVVYREPTALRGRF